MQNLYIFISNTGISGNETKILKCEDLSPGFLLFWSSKQNYLIFHPTCYMYVSARNWRVVHFMANDPRVFTHWLLSLLTELWKVSLRDIECEWLPDPLLLTWRSISGEDPSCLYPLVRPPTRSLSSSFWHLLLLPTSRFPGSLHLS